MKVDATSTTGHDAPVAVPLVLLDIWGIQRRHFAHAMTRMVTLRPHARASASTFTRLLGTGRGFTSADTDLTHWCTLTCWNSSIAPTATGAFADRWQPIAIEHAQLAMTPVASRGTWAGRTPFGPVPTHIPGRTTSTTPVASITRARVKWRHWKRFSSHVAPITDEIHDAGALFTLGIGEAPVGLQGTLSVWPHHQAVNAFAYRCAAHRHAADASTRGAWFSEELFARFDLTHTHGTYFGRPIVTS